VCVSKKDGKNCERGGKTLEKGCKKREKEKEPKRERKRERVKVVVRAFQLVTVHLWRK
jgi:hypothetical protein